MSKDWLRLYTTAAETNRLTKLGFPQPTSVVTKRQANRLRELRGCEGVRAYSLTDLIEFIDGAMGECSDIDIHIRCGDVYSFRNNISVFCDRYALGSIDQEDGPIIALLVRSIEQMIEEGVPVEDLTLSYKQSYSTIVREEQSKLW